MAAHYWEVPEDALREACMSIATLRFGRVVRDGESVKAVWDEFLSGYDRPPEGLRPRPGCLVIAQSALLAICREFARLYAASSEVTSDPRTWCFGGSGSWSYGWNDLFHTSARPMGLASYSDLIEEGGRMGTEPVPANPWEAVTFQPARLEPTVLEWSSASATDPVVVRARRQEGRIVVTRRASDSLFPRKVSLTRAEAVWLWEALAAALDALGDAGPEQGRADE